MVQFEILWALWFLQEVGIVCCFMPPHLYQRKNLVEVEKSRLRIRLLLKSQAQPLCEHFIPPFPLLPGWSIVMVKKAELQPTWPQRNTSGGCTKDPGTMISSQGCPLVIKCQCPSVFRKDKHSEDSIMSLLCTLWVTGESTKTEKMYTLLIFCIS